MTDHAGEAGAGGAKGYILAQVRARDDEDIIEGWAGPQPFGS